MRRRRSFPLRATALTSLIAFGLGPSGCMVTHWQAKPITDVSVAKDASQDVKVTTKGGMVELHVNRVEFPYVYGSVNHTSAGATVGVDLREVKKADVITFDRTSKSMSQRSISADAEGVRAATPGTIRFVTSTGTVDLAVERVEPPWAYGAPGKGTGQVRLDLREASWLEVQKRSVSVARTAGLVLGGALLIAIIAAAASSMQAPKSQGSCPLVYVDRGAGWEGVGLAYVGAAFRSIQRDDLLPLPSLPPGEVRVRLSDEADETENTDRVELVLVDHAADVRPVATFDGQVVLVSAGHGPREARDGAGRVVTALVDAADGSAWETDLVEVSQASPPFGERLTAAFAAPEGPGDPILEIVGANTLWMDMVFDRFFGAMGNRLEKYMTAANQASRRARLLGWREREGVDLTVEVLAGGRWRPVAVVPTIGATNPRRVAVPLPADVVAADASLKVRLRGGLGFWRIDHLAFSRRVDAAATTLRLAPASAVDPAGRDQREILAAADERYHVLETSESVDLRFAPPPVAEGRTRTAFLLTTGYYNVHPPIQGKWSPGTLRAIRDEPGGLSRFSRDLASAYVRLAQHGPRTAAAAGEDVR